MIWSWFKRRRRRRFLAEPFPRAWRTVLESDLEHWPWLDPDARLRLEGIVQVLAAEKRWVGCADLQLTDAVKVIIAAQAGTLLLGLEHDYYRNVDSILVYPSSYQLPRTDAYGMTTQQAVLGHAQLRGPVVLSWDAALRGGRDADDGRNLVYHEFAHKLDMLDGAVDGTPPLRDMRSLRRWITVMTEHFDTLRRRSARGASTLLDSYGATDVAEFFAVATETFFEKPRQMQKRQADLYDVLSDFYGQDPARWQR